MPLYDTVKDLALAVESVDHEPLALPLGFMTRRTTASTSAAAGKKESARTSPTRRSTTRDSSSPT